MTRLAYCFYRAITWARYWVPRRFTPAGLLVVTTLLASGAIGIDLDQSVASEVFILALGLLAVSIGTAGFFRARFKVKRLLPRFASVGQTFVYRVKVWNQTTRALREIEWLEDLADPRPSLGEFRALQRLASGNRSFHLTLANSPPLNIREATVKPTLLPALAPGRETEALVEMHPVKRGPLRFTGVTLARPDPFGLFRAFVRVPVPQTVLILPRRYSLPPIALAGARKYQQGGVALASAIGESDEFVSLRDYRPGDPMRRIHWRSWARAGRPIVREHQDEFFARHALILDTFAGPGQAAAFEEAVSVAASFVCTLETQESLLDVMFIGPQAIRFTAGRGLGQAEQALEILASVRACREKSFRALQDLVLQHAGAVCGCIGVLLGWDEPRRELVRQLRALGLPTLVLVVANAEWAETIRDGSSEEAAENFHVLEVGKVGEGLRQLGETPL